jgi:hypothetical protein
LSKALRLIFVAFAEHQNQDLPWLADPPTNSNFPQHSFASSVDSWDTLHLDVHRSGPVHIQDPWVPQQSQEHLNVTSRKSRLINNALQDSSFENDKYWFFDDLHSDFHDCHHEIFCEYTESNIKISDYSVKGRLKHALEF